MSGEYLTVHEAENTQTAAARSQLIEVSKEVVPRFLEELREGVYPYFASSAGENENYYRYGWRFRTWAVVSDPDGNVQAPLLAWARKYSAEEEWVLQGALSTLKRWHHDAALLRQLETRGFHLPVAGEILIADEEHYFEISDWGWDPQLLSWAAFRTRITKQFREELDRYEQRIRALSEARGAIKARRRFKREHLEWFALYQLKGWSSGRIVKWVDKKSGKALDPSTILKGVKSAAEILGWTSPRDMEN